MYNETSTTRSGNTSISKNGYSEIPPAHSGSARFFMTDFGFFLQTLAKLKSLYQGFEPATLTLLCTAHQGGGASHPLFSCMTTHSLAFAV